MTLTTVVYYKQEEFKTSLQYCKIEQTKCARETNSYRFVHIFIDNWGSNQPAEPTQRVSLS